MGKKTIAKIVVRKVGNIMALSIEYTRKIDEITKALPQRMYHPQTELDFSGFFTYDRLSLKEAESMERQPLPVGTPWGYKWQYGWFFAELTVPESCVGQPLLFASRLGECTVFVNGRVVGAFDQQHSHIKLTDCAKAGETFSIAMEVYAGHNEAPENGWLGGPQNFVVLVPEQNIQDLPEDVLRKTVTPVTAGLFSEDVFQLWMDFTLLYGLRNNLEEDALRRANIDKGLKKVCDMLDIEAPTAEFEAECVSAREILRPLLECKNGSTAPMIYAIGNSHLDLEWLWTKEETRRKSARTLGNQLELMKDYPDYKFISSQPWILETVKNEYPELFERVKQAVKDGQIIVEGSAYVEPDANIPSGESLVRQFLMGKKFVKDEFGINNEIFWLPDSFGMTGSLPQIMKGCGINYFFNAKVTWLYNDGERFPHGNFTWEGIDGTKVLTHIVEEYATELTADKIFEKWHQNPEKEEVDVRLLPYGYGDGGGGATRVHLETLKRTGDLEGMPKLISKSPNELFKYIEDNCTLSKNYVGELYYSAHRGTYTSQAKTKKKNRMAEILLREAEMWSTLFGTDAKAELDKNWKEVLFNQFHDILPGSSLQRVHERAEKSYDGVITAVRGIVDGAEKSVLKEQADAITLFNSVSWDRTVQITLPEGYTSIKDMDGKACAVQMADGKAVAEVSVPACGCKSFLLGKETATDSKKKNSLVLENALVRAEFNQKGQMVSMIDKQSGIEFLSAPSNVFRMYKDMPCFCDAWDIDSFYENLEMELPDCVIEPEYEGELYSSLLITKKLNESTLTQRAILRKDCPYVEFETEVDWKETHKLLKVDYSTNICTDELISEVQFGYIKRPTHSNREHDADRFEMCQQKWSAMAESERGLAILNDSKYGIGAKGNRMSLTLLKAGAFPDLHADKGIQTFTYAVMPFSKTLGDSGVIQAAYGLNHTVTLQDGLAEEKSLLQISKDNVIIDTVKTAEDGSGDIVIRLYESKKSYTNCELSLGFDVKEAYLTNMIEEVQAPLEVKDNKIQLNLRAFEVKTIKVKKA